MSTLTPTLDPAKLLGGGVVGSIELQAIYDTIVVFDHDTATYVGHTAQSLTPNSDFTIWTLKLKPGIMFTDGTPYDAAAVKFNIDRQAAPDSTASDKVLLTSFLASTTVVDPTTVTFTLKSGWAQFPFLLSDEVGMVASPAVITSLGANFGSTVPPAGAGAGPFKIKAFTPTTSLNVVRNDAYFGTKAYLDGVSFVTSPADSSVSEKNVAGGQFDLAYFTDPVATSVAKADGLNVLELSNNSGQTIAMNSAPGSPLNNVTVRQAVAAAIDPKTISTRVYSGTWTISESLLSANSVYNPGVPGPSFDLDKAKTLVAQAKSAGYNGNITLTVGNDPIGTNFGTTVKAMLDLAGFNTTIIAIPTANQTAQILVKKDYQLASFSLAFDDANAFFRLYQSFSSASNRYGYSSPAMDAALGKLQVASSKADVTAAMKTIAQIMTQDVPYLNLSSGQRNVAYAKKVHGVVQTSNQAVLLGGTWISK